MQRNNHERDPVEPAALAAQVMGFGMGVVTPARFMEQLRRQGILGGHEQTASPPTVAVTVQLADGTWIICNEHGAVFTSKGGK